MKSRIDEKLIIRVNELYHDLEREYYSARHPEIFNEERTHWEEYGRKYFDVNDRLICLDYGSGSGFVPSVVCRFLKGNDQFICADLSIEMLNIARENLNDCQFPFRPDFLKTDGRVIPVQDNSVDVITVNSVLHHLWNLDGFSCECRRILSPGGHLIICHEPNGERELGLTGRFVVNVAGILSNPSALIFGLVERSSMTEGLLRKILSGSSEYYKIRNKMLEKISTKLLEEGLVDRAVRGTEIQQLVDIKTEYGFKKNDLFENVFRNFELVEYLTYNHLGIAGEKNGITRRLDRYLQDAYANGGETFSCVLRKK